MDPSLARRPTGRPYKWRVTITILPPPRIDVPIIAIHVCMCSDCEFDNFPNCQPGYYVINDYILIRKIRTSPGMTTGPCVGPVAVRIRDLGRHVRAVVVSGARGVISVSKNIITQKIEKKNAKELLNNDLEIKYDQGWRWKRLFSIIVP